MRTATTIAKKHSGEWVLVSHPEVPIYEQQQSLRKLKGTRSHPDFATIQYQERDGHSFTITFMTPEKEKEADAARQAQSDRLKKLAADEVAKKAKLADDREKAKDNTNKKAVETHSANIEESKKSQKMPPKPKLVPIDPPKSDEPLKTDGPTLAEFAAAGYPAENYPPKGYTDKRTPEELAQAEAEKKAKTKPEKPAK